MPFFTSPLDDAQLYYADYRPSVSVEALQPDESREGNAKKDLALVFLHGWPMSSMLQSMGLQGTSVKMLTPCRVGRSWNRQILPLVESHGMRCIALDRRGFGRSEWMGSGPSQDVTYDTFAQDTAALLRSIEDLRDFVFVCSSMGCGESVLVQQKLHAAGLGGKCKGYIWLAPSLPYPLATEDNPNAPS